MKINYLSQRCARGNGYIWVSTKIYALVGIIINGYDLSLPPVEDVIIIRVGQSSTHHS
jgi:hypothetical protein